MYRVVEYWCGGEMEQVLVEGVSLEVALEVAYGSSLFGEGLMSCGEEGVQVLRGSEIVESF